MWIISIRIFLLYVCGFVINSSILEYMHAISFYINLKSD